MARVLQVVLSLGPGGAERLVIELCRRLSGEFDFAVCCLDEPGAWADGLRQRGVEVVALGRRPGFRPLLARQIARIARRTGATVLHCHEYSPFVYGTLAQLVARELRVISTEHGRLDDGRARFKRRLGTRLVTSLPVRVFAVCKDLRERLIDDGFPATRVEVILNGIDPGPEPTDERRHRARAALGVDAGECVIGSVGRLAPVKNFSSLMDAFAALQRVGVAARLVVLGDGPERSALMDRTQAAGLGASVLLPGHRDDARELMPAFDVFANSSTYEGISLTVLEAMAAGLPIVATRVGGTPEVVDDGVTGALVPPGSPDALAAAIEALVAAPARRARLGAAGRARVLQHFHIDRMAAQYASAYREARRRVTSAWA